jgi:CRISPR-associated protein Cmr6
MNQIIRLDPLRRSRRFQDLAAGAAAAPGQRLQSRGPGPGQRPPTRPPHSGGGKKDGKKDGGKKYYPLPREVRSEDTLDWRQCSNLALAWQRLLPYQEKWQLAKEDLGPKIAALGNRLREDAFPEGKLIDNFLARQQELLASLHTIPGLTVWTAKVKTQSRLSLGFGNTTPLETGLTLHRLYGLPYLPGSALKGICRAWALGTLAEKYHIPCLDRAEIDLLHGQKPKLPTPWEMLEDLLLTPPSARQTWPERLGRWQGRVRELLPRWREAPFLQDHLELEPFWQDDQAGVFRRLFGSQDQRGRVCFYDAFPVSRGQMFDLDIINVHYQPYYGNPNKYHPADYYSPVPNYFLTVAPGVAFQLFLTSPVPALAQTAGQWLTAGLHNLGLGAKTAIGYGILE